MNAAKIRYPFKPEFIVSPGEILGESIENLGMSQADLASRLGLSIETVSQIIKGEAPITPEIAIELESVFGSPARLWMNLEAGYREALARETRACNAARSREAVGKCGWQYTD